MYWHHKEVQISVFFDVIPHNVADTYTFQGNPLPTHSGSLTQKLHARHLLVGGGGCGGGCGGGDGGGGGGEV